MSQLDLLNAISVINKSTTTEVLKAEFFTNGQFKNSLLAVNEVTSSILKKDVKSITDYILKPINLEDFITPIELFIKRSGEISTIISRLTVPTNLSGTKSDISEGPYQMEAGAISFSTGTTLNFKAALSFNNSRQIVNRSQIIQTTADFIHEIGQQKYTKIESTYLESSKNRVEIVEEKDIVKAESIHSYATTYQNTAKNILIQAYPKKSKLGILPVELDIGLSLDGLPTLPIPDVGSIGNLAEKGLNALNLDTKSVSSVLGGVGKIAGNISKVVSTATTMANAVQNPRAFITDTGKKIIGAGLKAGINAGLTGGLNAAGGAAINGAIAAFQGSSLGGIINTAGNLLGGLGPDAGNVAAASLGEIAKGVLPGGLGGLGSITDIGDTVLGGLFSSGLSNPLTKDSNTIALLSTGLVELFAAKVAQILATEELTIASNGDILNVTNGNYTIKSNYALEALTKSDLNIEAQGFIKLSSRKVLVASRSVVSMKTRRKKVPKQITPFENKLPKNATFSPLEKVPVNPNTTPAKINQVGVASVAGSGGTANIQGLLPLDFINIGQASKGEAHPNTAEVIDDTRENIQPNETIEEVYA